MINVTVTVHVIKHQPVIYFHFFSSAVSQRDRAAARAASSSVGVAEYDRGGGGGGGRWEEGLMCHKHPLRFPPCNAKNATSLAGA